MERLLVKLLVWVAATALIQMQGYNGCLEKERIGLIEIKTFFISISVTNFADNILPSWVDDEMSDCCVWERVKCNTTTQRVIQLSLNQTRLFDLEKFHHEFPTLNFSLFLPFQELQYLNLSYNNFEGWDENNAAYYSFGSLKQLKMLNLGNNNFNDSILLYLTKLTSLTTLILENNEIEGIKPEQGLANLTKLQVLDLSWNRIDTGSAMRLGLANLTNLEVLDLGVNSIDTDSGTTLRLENLRNLKRLDLSFNYITISRSLASQVLANLTNLEVLDLSSNEISGSVIEIGFEKFRNLKALDLSDNYINGSLESQGICDLKNIVELNLGGNNFDGDLPYCLNNLTKIKAIDLSFNQLSGKLPSAIANLFSLEYLDLSGNNFKGVFSFSSIANLSKLQVFQLSNCSMQVENEKFPWLPKFQFKALLLRRCNLHSIPDFLLYQYELRLVDFSHNILVGAFPTWLLQNNTKLENLYLMNNSLSGILRLPNFKHDLVHLDISKNKFNGQLSSNLGEILPKLVVIGMSENNFEGNIPSSLGEMKRLELLDLSTNNFSGELPTQFVTGCILLSTLELSHNNFQGKVFPQYANFTNLEWLYLNNNNFSGKIEEGLSKATSLLGLDLSNNKFVGEIPHWIGNFWNLEYLLLSNNFLEGNIPTELNNLEFLRILDISENNLFGLPSSFNLSSLELLYMHKNAFNGPIPNVLRRSSRLVALDLRENNFCGTIPHWINEYSNLHILLLRNNYLGGHIPDQICQLKELRILDLSYNKFHGSIPRCFMNMTSWMLGRDDWYFRPEATWIGRILWDYYNSALHQLGVWEEEDRSTGQQEVQLMTKNRYESYKGSILNYMTGIDLSCNKLTGDIPSEIGNFSKIHALNLSHNLLSGFIPQSFSNLKMIESLDLSHNKLSGSIPPQLIELNFLSNFNVSYNNLSGPTPNGGQFANFDQSNYRGNPGLCGATINKSCTSVLESPETPIHRAEEDKSAIDMIAFYWSFAASFVSVVFALLFILWINSYWRKKWFYFIDTCIDLCFYWLLKYVSYK